MALYFYKKISKYDKNDLLIKTESHFNYANTSEEVDYTYSKDFRIKKVEKLNCVSNCFNKLYVYDSLGNEKYVYSLNNDKRVLLIQNSFDIRNNKIRVHNYKNGIHNSTIDYKYNSNGDPVYECSNYLDLNRIIIRNIKYVYDKKGNWIEKIELNEYNDLMNSYKRKIEYFDEANYPSQSL